LLYRERKTSKTVKAAKMDMLNGQPDEDLEIITDEDLPVNQTIIMLRKQLLRMVRRLQMLAVNQKPAGSLEDQRRK